MNPGRELDALVAVAVFGCRVEWTELRGVAGPIREPSCECFDDHHGGDKGFPCYSTDIADAWEVVEKLTSLREIRFDLKRIAGGEWEASFGRKNGASSWLEVFVRADTAPHAICLTALRTAGFDPKRS